MIKKMHEIEERKICCYVWPRGKDGTLTSLGHLLLTNVRIEYSVKKHNESLRKSPNLSTFKWQFLSLSSFIGASSNNKIKICKTPISAISKEWACPTRPKYHSNFFI